MPTNQIRQTRAVLDAIVPHDGAARGKLGAWEEFADLLKRSTVLQRETHQAGKHVVEADQFSRTVRAFHSKKNFCRLLVVMDADVKRALAGDFDFLCDVVATVGQGKPSIHEAPLSSTLTMLVLTWCQTILIQDDLRESIMTASPALIRLMVQHGCSQVGYLFDSSSWVGGAGLMVPLCSRNAHDKAVLVRRAQ